MAKQPLPQVQVLEQMTESIVRLHKLGGFSLVLSGTAILIFGVVALLSVFGLQTATNISQSVPRFYDFILIIGMAGAVIGGGERFLEYKLAAQKMRMMITLTEEMVRALIPREDALSAEKMGVIVESVFKEIWGFSAQSAPDVKKDDNPA